MTPHGARIARQLRNNRGIRAVGFDDSPFDRAGQEPIGVAGVICTNDRFEGMVWGYIEQDGIDATDVLGELLETSKFLPQLHVVLLDGVAMGGFNVIDIEALSERLNLPVITVMRQRPDMAAIEEALQNLPDPEGRLARIYRAGPVHRADHVYFQSVGLEPELVVPLLERLTREGHIPEPIRLAHLIGSAVATGQSGRRA